MMRLTTLALLGRLPSAIAAPTSLSGEWLLGPAFPAAVYDGAYSGATTDTARLLLRPDGQYVLTEIEHTYVPGYFGSYLVTCGSLTVTSQSGQYQRSGDQVTFMPKQGRRVTGLSPQALNAGCKRSEGMAEALSTPPYRGTFTLQGGHLSVRVGAERREYQSRAAAEAAVRASATPPPAPAASPAPVPSTRTAGSPITPQPWSATGEWEVVLGPFQVPGWT